MKPDRQDRYAFVGTKNRIGGELEFAVQSDDKARKSEELDAIRGNDRASRTLTGFESQERRTACWVLDPERSEGHSRIQNALVIGIENCRFLGCAGPDLDAAVASPKHVFVPRWGGVGIRGQRHFDQIVLARDRCIVPIRDEVAIVIVSVDANPGSGALLVGLQNDPALERRPIGLGLWPVCGQAHQRGGNGRGRFVQQQAPRIQATAHTGAHILHGQGPRPPDVFTVKCPQSNVRQQGTTYGGRPCGAFTLGGQRGLVVEGGIDIVPGTAES